MARRDRPTHPPPTSLAHGWTDRDLERLVREALSHLFDLPYLQTHPLARLLDPPYATRRANLGKAVEEALVEAIEALRPGQDADPPSHSWRGYTLLRLRYVEGQAVEAVQRQLGIGHSEYYRDHRQALVALTSMLVESSALRRSGSSPVHLGEHSSLPGLPSAEPSRSRRGNLPLQLTSFIGRERELAEVSSLLSASRLLTLTGAGGCGKTRLALEVAQGLLDEYQDGVWLVDLAPLVDPTLVPQTVASALGLREVSGQPILDTLVSYLEMRRLLLLLDNCEHLLEACAFLAETLLRSCPNLTVLATGREALGIAGETSWRVPSLSTPTSEHPQSLESLSEYEAVKLFVERVLLVRRDFALTEENAPAIAEVCRRLDGMPLALELAAAQAKALTVEEVAARLDDRFRLLTAGSRTALPRQQTLRATMDWSFALLTEEERILFRRLAVFAGGFTLEAAEAVGQGGEVDGREVLDLLLQLVYKSLVQAESAERETRYRYLETIRQYAWERLLESGEVAAIQEAHAGYFLRLVERAAPELDGPRQRELLDRLEAERDNLRAALRWLEGAGDAERGLRMVTGLFHLWMQRGPTWEAVARLTAVLALPGAKETPLGVQALTMLARFTSFSAGHGAARPHAEEALRLGRAVGDQRALAWALWTMGGSADDLQAARRCNAEALAIFRELGDEARCAGCLRYLGQHAWRSGDLTVARARFGESLAIYRRLGAPWPIGMLLFQLAEVTGLQGDLSTAWKLLEESLRCLTLAGDRTFFPWPICGQARVLRLQGEYERARSLAQTALELGQEVGNQDQTSWSLDELGLLASAQGDFTLARQHLEASLARGRERHDHFHVASTLAYLGLVARAEGDYQEARSLLSESLALQREGPLRELGERSGVAVCLGNLGVVVLLDGKLEEARGYLVESLALRREIGDTGGLATLLESFGGLAALRDQPERAVRLLSAGARIREEIGNVAPPVWRRQRDPWLERARKALEPARAETAWAEWQAMTVEEAIEYALAEDDDG